MIKSNKGFALMETLVVGVFVVTVFMFVFTNFYPLVAKYEKAEYYDDVESKYVVHYLRKFIVEGENNINLNNCNNHCQKIGVTKNGKEFTVQGTFLSDEAKRFAQVVGIDQIYLTEYNIANFRSYVNSNKSSFPKGFVEYIESLPEENTTDNTKKRLIISIDRKTKEMGTTHSYATIEVKRNAS